MIELLEAIRELLAQKTVDCPRTTEFFNDLRGAGLNNPRLSNCVDPCYADCPKCKGTGQVPNPDYDPLREVVGKSCPQMHTAVDWCYNCAANHCWLCHGSGSITRSWEGKPDWWLATLLMRAADKAGLNIHSDGLFGLWDDPSKAAEAVIAALKERKDVK